MCAVCLAFLSITPAASEVKVRSIALLGDSLTWLGGDSCTNPKGWSHYLRESGITDNISVFARSGSTWTNSSDTKPDTESYTEILDPDNVIYNQILRLGKRIDADPESMPEIIIVMAGTNDAWFSDRFPDMFAEEDIASTQEHAFPSQVTSLSGSVSLGCMMLQKMAPESNIILVAPLQNAKVPAETVHHVSEIIETASSRLGIKTLRSDLECCIRHEEEATSPRFTYDGVHTNPLGASLVAEYILSQLKTEN